MTNTTRASSRLPVIIIVLAVVAVALYFGRDFLRTPEPPRLTEQMPAPETETGNVTSPAPTAVAGTESEAPAEPEGVSAEAVADRIVDKLTTTPAMKSTAEAGDDGGARESTVDTEMAEAASAGNDSETTLAASGAASDTGGLLTAGESAGPEAGIASGAVSETGSTPAAPGTPAEETLESVATTPVAGRGSAEDATAALGNADPEATQAARTPTEADSTAAPGTPAEETLESAAAGPAAVQGSTEDTTAALGTADPEATQVARTPAEASSTAVPDTPAEEMVETAKAAPGAADATGAPSGAEAEALIGEIADLVADKIAEVNPPPTPTQVAGAAAETADEVGLHRDRLKHAVTEAVVEEQAENFVAALVEPEAHPIDVSQADHFVPMEQVISLLPETSFEVTTRSELLSDPEIGPHTPITVVRAVEQIEIADPNRIIASAGGDLDREIRILDGDEIRVETVRQVLRDFIDTSMETIRILAEVKYFDVTTLSEFSMRTDIGPDEPLAVVKGPYRLEAATVAELLREELDLPSNAILYLRTVRPSDTQGIWGIVQDGLIGNFARGMAIRYGQSINTYQVEIPRDADEQLANQSSSFLGKLIHAKTIESHVYNFMDHRMGRNPHRIYPDQEIAIINFTPEELVSIYKHFVAQEAASG